MVVIVTCKNEDPIKKEDFSTFSYCKCTGDDDPRGVANLDPKHHDWQDLCRVPLIIATHKI